MADIVMFEAPMHDVDRRRAPTTPASDFNWNNIWSDSSLVLLLQERLFGGKMIPVSAARRGNKLPGGLTMIITGLLLGWSHRAACCKMCWREFGQGIGMQNGHEVAKLES